MGPERIDLLDNRTRLSASHRTIAVLKVCYLFAVTAILFAVPAVPLTRPARWVVIPALLSIQIITLLACRVDVREIFWAAWQLKWLFVFLLGTYALLPPETPSDTEVLVDWRLPALGWSMPINVSGLEQAALMCLQIITMLLASTLVRSTGTGRDLIEGLHAFHLPPLFVHALDRTLELLTGNFGAGRGREAGGGRGAGGGHKAGDASGRGSRVGLFGLLKQIVRGDFSAFVERIRANIAVAENRQGTEINPRTGSQLTHDVAIVAGIALCMASLKVLKLLPGIPFAPGYKTVLLFPLYVLAARMTHSRWGATAAGSIMGVIGFLQGDGRFGVLEILKHVAPGFVIDMGEPLARRLPSWALGYCVLGFFAAIARTATEFMVVLLLGARAEIYLFPAVKLVPNLVAGVLSGFVTVIVLRLLAGPTPAPVEPAADFARVPDAGDKAAILQQQNENQVKPFRRKSRK